MMAYFKPMRCVGLGQNLMEARYNESAALEACGYPKGEWFFLWGNETAMANPQCFLNVFQVEFLRLSNLCAFPSPSPQLVSCPMALISASEACIAHIETGAAQS